MPADGSKDEGAFDDRLAALKKAKKQAAYGSSRKEKDKDGGLKQGERMYSITLSHVLQVLAGSSCSCTHVHFDQLCYKQTHCHRRCAVTSSKKCLQLWIVSRI